MTALATPLIDVFALANIVMLFLLATVVIAVKFGRDPAVLAAVLNVAAFDFFFVEPRLSFAVSDVQYLVTFAVYIGHLRHKLEADPSQPQHLLTETAVGYRLLVS